MKKGWTEDSTMMISSRLKSQDTGRPTYPVARGGGRGLEDCQEEEETVED